MKKANQKKLRTMYELGISISKLSEIFKVTPSQIIGICKGVKRR